LKKQPFNLRNHLIAAARHHFAPFFEPAALLNVRQIKPLRASVVRSGPSSTAHCVPEVKLRSH
jgi:hypothetical protein